MKKLIVFCFFLALTSCKKKNEISDNNLIEKKWVLVTATINPAITLNGVTSTDYKSIHGSGSCLSSNYTLSFYKEGWYSFSSNGPLCDMLAASKDDTWTRDGSSIKLKSRTGKETTLDFTGETISYVDSFVTGSPSVNYKISYIFKAK